MNRLLVSPWKVFGSQGIFIIPSLRIGSIPFSGHHFDFERGDLSCHDSSSLLSALGFRCCPTSSSLFLLYVDNLCVLLLTYYLLLRCRGDCSYEWNSDNTPEFTGVDPTSGRLFIPLSVLKLGKSTALRVIMRYEKQNLFCTKFKPLILISHLNPHAISQLYFLILIKPTMVKAQTLRLCQCLWMKACVCRKYYPIPQG